MTFPPRRPKHADTRAAYRSAMKHLIGSVAIVTARHGEQLAGITVTSLTSVSLEPPSLLVCINSNASAHGVLASAQRFSVSILSENHSEIADIFAGRGDHSSQEDRFLATHSHWLAGTHNAPVLKEAVGHLSCEQIRGIECGTHTILIGAVDLATPHNADAWPLLYGKGAYRNAQKQNTNQ